MARGTEGNEMATPRPKPSLTKQSSSQSSSKQQTLLGFFQKKSDESPRPDTNGAAKPSRNTFPTPASSSEPRFRSSPVPTNSNKENDLRTKMLATKSDAECADEEGPSVAFSSPLQRSKKHAVYIESSDNDEDEPIRNPSRRAAKRRKLDDESDASDQDFAIDKDAETALLDQGTSYVRRIFTSDEADMDDFIASEVDQDLPVKSRRPAKKAANNHEALPPIASSPSSEDVDMPSVSTAQQWNYDPTNPRAVQVRTPHSNTPGKKQKAHMSEPEQRYPWLATVQDADRHPPDHVDYDPRTIFIPPLAWSKFSPFEKQYWEIKQKFWDTIVFFKKGKFYELYENDATIGHQLFNLKLTDRVNMRMVGVPEASLDHWANQFVAKGFKIARVDQLETALGKDMRERDEKTTAMSGKPRKEEKVIRRELATVLTAGTLVDGGMLQDDMATFCAAIKESEIDGLPTFGIAFVDTATGQFHLVEIFDDTDMTKFETFVAQTRPGELVLEKGRISRKAMRILKSNTSPATIWNNLKPDTEFLTSDKTALKIDGEHYFDNWPVALREARNKESVFSAFGGLLWYLAMLKIERELVSLGNFNWYDPIRKATSLVLDGQSLINLEIFANSFDGGSEGTLFALLNRCITPFGKRMLRQWVAHPLADVGKITARLDAVDALLADSSVTERFTASLSKLPDLERLISRVHAGRCKTQDFINVLEGFEQIEYTMGLLAEFGQGDGVIGQLITAMPDLAGSLEYWRDAFDRAKARSDGVLVPAPGVESDFDQSEEHIDTAVGELDDLLKKCRKQLGSSAIKYTDNGKEIYQMEVPVKIKQVPKTWKQMSATKQVKRYYFTELEDLVQTLKEAQETHGQIVKLVASRFFARFDKDYTKWLAAVKIVAHLDCLISLAKASASLGEPSCRPVFVQNKRTVIEFQDLRHPTMLTSVSDFIPNSIALGGNSANIDLLTGANAAGKSTILRMTCIAVILAQIGCHVPCSNARLSPIDRIMSRIGAQDNIFAGQSTFMVELSETKKILSEATPRSLVILDELGRGTSSYDGVAVAQAVLHHIATHVGCIGFFATHYHSLAAEFHRHPEIVPRRMAIQVDDEAKRVTFLYRLETGVAEGSFGMHCASMCGIAAHVVDNADKAAREWEHTGRLKVQAEDRGPADIPLGMLSDVSWILRAGPEHSYDGDGLDVFRRSIAALG